ncbi:MAG: hypothetical protein JST01_22040 [Cyanobacteria bacterium SZAS TMP-1]|nr:hypothetical protein [Cyanobacteria bacterium SZAS TMP-1]
MSNQNTTSNATPQGLAPQPPLPPLPPPVVVPSLPPIPTTAPSSSNNIRAVTPGWQFQPGNPGTMADVSKVVDSRVIDASKIYNGGLSPEFAAQQSGLLKSLASNTVQGPASIVELARALKNDPQLIFEWVYNNIEWEPGWGVQKGALGALLDGCGNSFDQSMLLVALLRQAGFVANYSLGQIKLTTTQYDAWFGTDSTTNAYCCYYYAQYANIPGSAPTWDGTNWNMVMSHVWVQVVISGTTYLIDPSRKTYTRKTPVASLATILGYNQTTFLTDAQNGATVDASGNFVQNMNATKIATDLTTMSTNLVNYIKNNAVGSAPAGTATMDDVLGGQSIVPITLPFAWSTTLAYENPGDVPTIWTGDVPLTYKTTLQVQYPLSPSGWAIDQTFTSDQLAGGRLTLTFDGTLHPVLTLNGTVVATGSQAQGAGTWNSVLLTVNHNAYASPVYPQQWWQSFIYAGQYYLIGNAWGNLGRGQYDFHNKQLAAAKAAASPSNEAINGEFMSTIWFDLVAQSSRVADLVGRLRKTHMNFFHQVGIVSMYFNAGVPTAGTDVGGVSGFSSTLNYDFTQLAPTNTVVAMHGVALEAASLAQFNGIKPGVSTTTVIDRANRTANVTIGGTKTTGNTLTITANDAALPGGTKSKTYTVLAGDTLTTIATGLKNLINADTDFAAAGITAVSSGTLIMVSSTSVNQTSYTVSKSAGATETIAVAFQKVYKGTSSNWNTGANIQAALVANGYNSTDMSNIYSNYLSGGGNSVLLGDTPGLPLGSWTGWGDWIFPTYSNNGGAYGLINNSAKGGGGQPGNGSGPSTSPNPTDSSPGTQNQGGDPIVLSSGDFIYSNNDLSIGSGEFPYTLTMQRFYSSANQYSSGVLGRGWGHGFQMSATVGSDGLLAMGSQFAAQGAATIAELFVASDLATDTAQGIVKLVTMSLSNKWWIDQLVNNTVVVNMPQDANVFVKQPDGTYTASGRAPSTLTLTVGAFTVTTPQKVKYNFNTSGQISTIVYPSGVTLTFTYTSGNLTSVTNGMGRTLTLNYTSGILTSVTDGTGRSVSYTVTSGNLVTFTDANSKNTTYSYDNPGRMTAYYLPANPLTAFATNVYDSLSHVKTQSNARSQVWNYYFAGSRTEIVDPLTNKQIMYFNNMGGVIRSIDGLGKEWDYNYDGLNRLVQLTMPEGNQMVFTYDANNNLLTRTQVPKAGSGLSNIVETFTYDPSWAKVKTYKDGNLNVTTYTYDSTLGNLLKIQRPTISGSTPTSIMTWNGRGQVLSRIDETGIQTQLNYDSSTEKTISIVVNTNWSAIVGGTITTGDVLTLTAHDTLLSGGQKSVTYTVHAGDTLTTIAAGLAAAVNADSSLAAIGVVAYSTGPAISLATHAGNTTIWTKTTPGTETITLAAGLNLTTSFGCDAVGNVNSIQDPNGNTATFVSDNLRRLTQKTDPTPFGYVTNLNYDDNSNLLNVQRQTGTTPAWQIFSWTWSTTNKKLTETDPASNATTWTYDGADRLQTVTDAQSRQWQYSYDACNRFYQIKDPTNTVCDTRTYTDNGLLASVKDVRNNTTQNTYDGLDRLNKTIYADTTFEQNSSYDSNGNVLTRLTRSGNSVVTTYDVLNRPATKTPTGQPVVTYTFDLANRLTQISKPVVSGDPSSGNFQFAFDTAGRFYQETYPDGKTVTHVLDSNGNQTQTTWPDGYFINRLFDQLNRLTNIKLNGSSTSAVIFAYNQLSQRTQLTYSNGATIVYAPQLNGDVTSIAHNFVGSSVTFTYGFNNVHEPNSVAVSDNTYMWHPAGAATTSYGAADSVNKYPTVAGNTFIYDGNKNLTGDGTWTYAYDTENHLLSAAKTGTSVSMVYDPVHRQSQKTVGTVKSRYIYSRWQRIADYDGTTGTLQNRYVCGTSPDEVLLMVSSGGTLTFLHADIVGSIVATSNSSGAVTNKNLYSTFGEITTLGGTNVGFTGQRYDSEMGLCYFKRRYYSPSLGRFLQTDPAGYSGPEDYNLYSYVGNSPLKFTDPMGTLGAVAVILIIVGAFITALLLSWLWWRAQHEGSPSYTTQTDRNGHPGNGNYYGLGSDLKKNLFPQQLYGFTPPGYPQPPNGLSSNGLYWYKPPGTETWIPVTWDGEDNHPVYGALPGTGNQNNTPGPNGGPPPLLPPLVEPNGGFWGATGYSNSYAYILQMTVNTYFGLLAQGYTPASVTGSGFNLGTLAQ